MRTFFLATMALAIPALSGTIIIEKVIAPTPTRPTPDNTILFDFTRDYASSPFKLGNNDADVRVNVPPGLHWVSEVVSFPYTISNISCDLSSGSNSFVQIYNSANGSAGINDTSDFKPGDNAIAIQLADGDTVDCQFTDEPGNCGDGIIQPDEECDSTSVGCDTQCHLQGAIKIIKQFAPCHENPTFEFSAPWNNSFNLGNGDSNDSGYLSAGQSYTISERNSRDDDEDDDWTLKSITCVCFQIDFAGNNTEAPCQSQIMSDLINNSVTVNLHGAELVQCTFLNEHHSCEGHCRRTHTTHSAAQGTALVSIEPVSASTLNETMQSNGCSNMGTGVGDFPSFALLAVLSFFLSRRRRVREKSR